MMEGGNFEESPEGHQLPQNFPEIEFDLGSEPDADLSNFLDLRQPWDGTQPEVPLEERQAVESLFSSKVDDVLLGHFEDTGNYTGSTTDLNLKYAPGDGKAEINITVLRNESQKGTLRVINVSQGEKVANYASEVEGTIIRTDLEESFNLNRQSDLTSTMAFADGDTPEILAEKHRNYSNHMEQVIANHDLEVSMGLASQPISLDEAQRLFDLIDNSEVDNN
jgi:hypothetical protein